MTTPAAQLHRNLLVDQVAQHLELACGFEFVGSLPLRTLADWCTHLLRHGTNTMHLNVHWRVHLSVAHTHLRQLAGWQRLSLTKLRCRTAPPTTDIANIFSRALFMCCRLTVICILFRRKAAWAARLRAPCLRPKVLSTL
jgi:hypothetical protein